MLFAGRAIIPMDRLLRHHRRDLVRNVLDDPRARSLATLHRPAAAGADFQPMLHVSVHLRRRLATRTVVSVPGPRLFLSPWSRRLLIYRNHGRGRERSGGPLQLSKAI